MENKLEILPVINTDAIREKANEYALKGALKEVEEFYTGYNSPYRKAIKEELENQKFKSRIDLPDILALINEKLSKEIDLIANTAISKSFLPLVNEFLTRVDKEICFSDILKEFIEATEQKDPYDCSVEVNKSEHGWLNVKIQGNDYEYDITIHEKYETKKLPTPEKRYYIGLLPWKWGSKTQQTMKVSLDGVELELPFTKDILSDKFTSYIARVILANSAITMDTDYFDEDWFPRDECHCH